MSNSIPRATSRVTEGLVGNFKEWSDHIANRVYRETFLRGITQGVDLETEADVYGGHQFGKGGSENADASGARSNATDDSVDRYLRSIYDDRYHVDGSARAQEYARSLASLPDRYHRIVAAHMKEYPDGGIWLGSGRLHDLGHAAWSATRPRDEKPAAWPDGSTWDDVGGVYSERFRALLVGHAQHSRKATAPHEFGHALDDALDRPSKEPVFSQFHTMVLRHIQVTSPKGAEYFARPGESGKRELFAEGIAWREKTVQNISDGVGSAAPPEFYGSVAAGRHLTSFYEALERELGITR
ncbi:hypothetical protein AB0H42_06055 [Nocardia sp. NPDC050799]|uniref:hypothetical protein n=1 Tax=Nocardia sp. NPDC050799 TaxID=3154842 RepID=UPI0033D6A483